LQAEITFSITAGVNRNNIQAGKDIERLRIERALAVLQYSVSRCREEDVRYGTGVLAALEFLAMRADEQWPFEQFRGALANAGMDTTQPEARGKCLMPR